MQDKHFKQHLNTNDAKWKIVADSFNDGFTYLGETFPPLDQSERIEQSILQARFTLLFRSFQKIMMETQKEQVDFYVRDNAQKVGCKKSGDKLEVQHAE